MGEWMTVLTNWRSAERRRQGRTLRSGEAATAERGEATIRVDRGQVAVEVETGLNVYQPAAALSVSRKQGALASDSETAIDAIVRVLEDVYWRTVAELDAHGSRRAAELLVRRDISAPTAMTAELALAVDAQYEPTMSWAALLERTSQRVQRHHDLWWGVHHALWPDHFNIVDAIDELGDDGLVKDVEELRARHDKLLGDLNDALRPLAGELGAFSKAALRDLPDDAAAELLKQVRGIVASEQARLAEPAEQQEPTTAGVAIGLQLAEALGYDEAERGSRTLEQLLADVRELRKEYRRELAK